MKKKFLSVFLSAMLMTSLSFVVSAEDAINFSIDEKNEIIKSIEEYGKQADNVKTYSTNKSISTTSYDVHPAYDVRGYDLDKAYEIFYSNGWLIDDYEKYGNFKTVIDETIVTSNLCVPADNMIVVLVPDKETGKYEASGTEEYGKYDVDFISETERLKNEIDEKILDVTYLKFSFYELDAIYLRTENNEYVVPYFYEAMQRTVRERLERGKLYTAKEFILRMDSTFDIENNDPNTNGGVPIKSWKEWDEASILAAVSDKNNDEKNYFAVYAVAIGTVIAIGGVGFFIFEKKRKKIS